jgi:hypothetical protein
MRKQAKKYFFASKRKKFCFRFASFRFKAKMMAVVCFRFASFRFFFVLFSLRSIFVSLQVSTFRIDAEQVKKALFSHRPSWN